MSAIRYKKWFVISLFLFSFIASHTALAANAPVFSYPSQPLPPNIETFIGSMVQKHGFNKDYLEQVFAKAEVLPAVIKNVKQPLEKESWDSYRSLFITPLRVNGGSDYLQNHQTALGTVEKEYGVPGNVITAIIGVETLYGKHTAQYQTLGALTTLAFYHNERAAFFQRELEQFLILSRQNKFDPLTVRGSYAGAIGIPQFIPSTYLNYGVSYTQSPQVDLLDNHNDAIASIANYLKRSGWQANQPIALPATVHGNVPAKLLASNGRPNTTIGELAKQQIFSPVKLPHTQKVGLIAMDQRHGKQQYWLIFPNFHAIMLYNPRTSYALAVFQLSEAIKERYAEVLAQGATTYH